MIRGDNAIVVFDIDHTPGFYAVNEDRHIKFFNYSRETRIITLGFATGETEAQAPVQNVVIERALLNCRQVLVGHIDRVIEIDPEDPPKEVDREYFCDITLVN